MVIHSPRIFAFLLIVQNWKTETFHRTVRKFYQIKADLSLNFMLIADRSARFSRGSTCNEYLDTYKVMGDSKVIISVKLNRMKWDRVGGGRRWLPLSSLF